MYRTEINDISGKKIRKKDLGMIAKSYGYVYVAQVAMGTSQTQYFSRRPRTPLNKSNEVSNKPLLAALQTTGNPERELSTVKIKQMKRRTPAPEKSSPQNKSKSSSPSSANPDCQQEAHHQREKSSKHTKGEAVGLALSVFGWST